MINIPQTINQTDPLTKDSVSLRKDHTTNRLMIKLNLQGDRPHTLNPRENGLETFNIIPYRHHPIKYDKSDYLFKRFELETLDAIDNHAIHTQAK